MVVRTEEITEVSPAASGPPVPRLRLSQQRRIFILWLILSDTLFLSLALHIAYWVRFEAGLTASPEVVPGHGFYPSLGTLLVAVSVVVFAVFRLYDSRVLLGGVSEYSRIFHGCTTSTMLVILVTFVKHDQFVSRVWLSAAWLSSFLLVALGRFVSRRGVYSLRAHGYLLVPAVVVGTNPEGLALAATLSDHRASGIRLIGFVSGVVRHQPLIDGQPLVVGSIINIAQIVADHGIEDLIVAITALTREELLRLCEEVNRVPGLHLRLSSGLYELLTTNVSVTALGDVPLVSLSKVRLDLGELCAKTLLEYAVAAASALLLLPLFAVLALIVKLDSPGPVIYRRRVLGVSGQEFDAYKFRTMYVNGDALIARSPKLTDELRTDRKLKIDPRVTRVGRWLRKYSLDELPQLVNVLRGQMGLVGPRMITSDEVEKYGQHKLNLLTVKPGMTGLWQVNGRSNLSYDERIRLDMYYIRNYSVWLDLQILFVQTIPAVLRSRGAH